MYIVAHAVLAEPPYKVRVAEVTVPSPGPGEALVKVEYTAMSPGTELRCLAGKQPDTLPGEFIPGYAASGTVVGLGEGCQLELETRVYCGGTAKANQTIMWGGHCSAAVRPESEIYVIPEGVDFLSAAFAHQAGIAWRGVRLAKPNVGDNVVVVGLGTIGQLSARLFASQGADVLALDLDPKRVELAIAAGVHAKVPTEGITAAVHAEFGQGADIVVDATGHEAVIRSAIDAARVKPWDDSLEPGPIVVIQGSYPTTLPIPYQEAFVKEITFLVPRDCQPSDIRTVLAMMAAGSLKTADLASVVAAPHEAAATYERLRMAEPGIISAAIYWGGVID